MKNFINILLGAIVALYLSACATTQTPLQPEVQKSTFIVMKTPVFRYADQGFIQKSLGVTKLEIYANGTAVMKLEIKSGKICNGTGLFSCMSKGEFNKRYLSAAYPDDTFEQILRGEAIFGGENINSTSDTMFTQNITEQGIYDIDYSVTGGDIIFRDLVTNILIKVRENI